MDVPKERIRAAMGYAGIRSYEELAGKLGMKTSTFNRRVYGEYPWKTGDLIAISKICGVPPWFLERGFEAATSRDEDDASAEMGLGLSQDPDDDEGERTSA